MAEETQTSQASKISIGDQATNQDEIVGDSMILTESQMLGLDEVSDAKLSYDWEKDLRMSKAFEIPDSEPNSLTDQQLAEDRHKQFEAQFLVPEPPSLSGITDSTTNKSSSSNTTSIEEKYVEDDMSSLSKVSDIMVSKTPPKHEFGKEKVERKGNVYDRLYNACLMGRISIINGILKKCTTTLMPDEDGRTPLYAACIGDHPEVVKLLVDSGYEVNHQDVNGKTPLHVAFENHALILPNFL